MGHKRFSPENIIGQARQGIFRYEATDGSGAVIAMETLGSEAAGAYPITPSTQMGEGFAVAVAAGL